MQRVFSQQNEIDALVRQHFFPSEVPLCPLVAQILLKSRTKDDNLSSSVERVVLLIAYDGHIIVITETFHWSGYSGG